VADVMTEAEIHDFAVEVVVGYLRREGHQIVAVNAELGANPQIVAKKNNQLEFVVVRTACYPQKGTLNASFKPKCIAHAEGSAAICYFASVGIANSSGKSDAEMAVPIKGVGFYVAFDGIELLHGTN
jgi:hypothetical protein